MKVYKFRVLTDEKDDFIRDLELTEDQTFYDFHLAILQTTSLAGSELSSFFICDQDWFKQSEIMLLDMAGPRGESPNGGVMQQYVMEDSCIDDFMTDSKQRILYEYDFLNPKTFFIELIDVIESDPEVRYPHCSLRKGLLNIPVDQKLDLEVDDELDASALLKDFNSLLFQTLDKDDEEEDEI